MSVGYLHWFLTSYLVIGLVALKSNLGRKKSIQEKKIHLKKIINEHSKNIYTNKNLLLFTHTKYIIKVSSKCTFSTQKSSFVFENCRRGEMNSQVNATFMINSFPPARPIIAWHKRVSFTTCGLKQKNYNLGYNICEKMWCMNDMNIITRYVKLNKKYDFFVGGL